MKLFRGTSVRRNRRGKLLLLLGTLCAGFGPVRLTAQRLPLGTWRTHLSYQSITTLSVAGERIYGGSPSGLFYFDRSDNNAVKLSRIDGLAEADVSQIAYDPAHRTALIAYQSGNIDLITAGQQSGASDQITNIPVIAQADLQNGTNTYDIFYRGAYAYLSGDYGMIVLDWQQRQVQESYQYIGTGGSAVRVWAGTVANDSLFLASSQGVLVAPFGGNANLQDYNNWRPAGPNSGRPAGNVQAIAGRNAYVYAGVSGNGIYKYQQGVWTNIYPLTEAVQRMTLSNNQILICTDTQLLLLDENDNLSRVTDPLLRAPRQAAYDEQGKLWVADAEAGLLSNSSGAWALYVPNGPATNATWKLYTYNNQIVALPGGYDGQENRLNQTAGFSVFDGSSWRSYNRQSAPATPAVNDLVTAAYQPAGQQLFLGSFGDGLLVQQPDQRFATVTGSPLVASPTGIRVTGLTTDANGNLWVTNHGVPAGQPSLHVLSPSQTWQSFTFPLTGARYPLDVLIDINGFKWLRLDPKYNGDVLVFDEKTNRTRYLSTALNNGELPNANVRSMALDREGQIWVGTDNGVAVFFNTGGVFTGNYGAFTPIFDGRRLLNNEFITAITVDAGNRKWIGTRNGLWLLNADGSEVISNFTTANSPLLSDNIVDVAIAPATGEVFIATDKGILSYAGTATEAGPGVNQVKVFPNPVKPNFDGLVGISGLAENSIVKITDVAGRLVYQTRSNGGTATWNVQDYQGNRARTGIYLIFSAAEDGTETYVAKLAVIH